MATRYRRRREAGADEGDVVADREQVEVQQHVERPVDHVHANYMDHVQVGVAAELAHLLAVVTDECRNRAARPPILGT